MEEIPKNIEKEISELTSYKPSTRVRRWTLLFVGDHGKIISVSRFKGLALTAVFVFIIAVAAAVCLYFLYQDQREENKKLQEDLQVSQQIALSLRDKKDILMARLVVAESKIADSIATAKKPPAEKIIPKPPLQRPSVETISDAGDAAKNALIAKKQPGEKSASGKTTESFQEVNSPGVAVEDLLVFNEGKNNTLHVQFKLINTNQNSQSVSGRAFVILKESEADKDQWLTFPSVSLTSGKPSQIYKGQYFSIARFKPMNFEKNIQVDLKRFKSAKVFIFASTGELLLEKNLPIEMEESVVTPDK